MEQEAVRWKLIFSGRVQFVGFRYTAYRLARDLRLTGWVDNLPDGRVAMEVQGPVSDVRRLIVKLKAQPQIRITGMEHQALPLLSGERKFRVLGYDRF